MTAMKYLVDQGGDTLIKMDDVRYIEIKRERKEFDYYEYRKNGRFGGEAAKIVACRSLPERACDDEYFVLGTYKDEEMARKVVGDIASWLYRGTEPFIMPKDAEGSEDGEKILEV